MAVSQIFIRALTTRANQEVAPSSAVIWLTALIVACVNNAVSGNVVTGTGIGGKSFSFQIPDGMTPIQLAEAAQLALDGINTALPPGSVMKSFW